MYNNFNIVFITIDDPILSPNRYVPGPLNRI